MMPVSTSPVPPVAMPGLPVELMTCRTASAITVPWPLSKTTSDAWAASAVAAPIRSLGGPDSPVNRANSPGCGVSTRGPAWSASDSRRVASAFKPSASTTIGDRHFAEQRRHQLGHFSGLPQPGTNRDHGRPLDEFSDLGQRRRIESPF